MNVENANVTAEILIIDICGEDYELVRLSDDLAHVAKPADKRKGYTVCISIPYCSCPDFRYRSQNRIASGLSPDCKHITALKRLKYAGEEQ